MLRPVSSQPSVRLALLKRRWGLDSGVDLAPAGFDFQGAWEYRLRKTVADHVGGGFSRVGPLGLGDLFGSPPD